MYSKKYWFGFLAAFSLSLLVGCSEQPGSSDTESMQSETEPEETDGMDTQADNGQSGRSSWLYQLQYAEPAEIAESGYEMAVIDPTANGKDETRYTAAEINGITENGTTVLAYLSIGEASAFKSYWQEDWGREIDGVLHVEDGAPEWLGRHPNPSWPESVKVRYWEEDWWDILEPELDAIKEAGFSGVYLDIVDGFFYWGNEETYEQESRLPGDPQDREEAALRMMDLVKRIDAYLNEDDSDLLVFPQNAESILQYDDGSYLQAIDGIGSEDIWFSEDQRIDTETTQKRLSYIQQVQDAGKPVLSVDYVLPESPNAREQGRVNEYFENCETNDFYCFAAQMDRELDEFIPQ